MTGSIRFPWERAVLTSDLPTQAKALAFVLANHMDPRGRCFLSNATLAAESSMSRSRVGEWKKVLRDGGWIEVLNSSGGRPGQVPTYVASFPPECTVPADREGGETPVPLPGETLPATGTGPFPLTGTEQTLEQTREQTPPPVDDDDQSMIAWMVLDHICEQIDGVGFEQLPKKVRLESQRCVASALGVSTIGAVLDQLSPPTTVRSKPGLVLSMARSLADDPPADIRREEMA